MSAVPRLTPIPDWPGYFLSRDGRLWSARKPGSYGGLYATPRVLRLQRRGKYARATLRDQRNGRTLQISMHVLMTVYIGPRPGRLDVCHRDGNELNNHIDNLRWGSRSSNMLEKYRHGRMPLGSRHPQAVLTESEALDIYQRFRAGSLMPDMQRLYPHVSRECLNAIRYERTWVWLTNPQSLEQKLQSALPATSESDR